MRFNSRAGAAVLLLLAGLYAGASLATDYSARSELPPDWSGNAADAGIDVWKSVARMAGVYSAVVVDVREAGDYARYHVPGSLSMPGARASEIVEACGFSTVIIVAAKDDQAQKLAGEARSIAGRKDVFFLSGGARSWYLALDLPVPMFNDSPEPYGYRAALDAVKRFLAHRDPRERGAALDGAYALARMSYEPTLLKSSSKPKAGGSRKKIAGGCGG